MQITSEKVIREKAEISKQEALRITLITLYEYAGVPKDSFLNENNEIIHYVFFNDMYNFEPIEKRIYKKPSDKQIAILKAIEFLKT